LQLQARGVQQENAGAGRAGPVPNEEHAVIGLLNNLLDLIRWGEPWDLEADLEAEDPLLPASSWVTSWTDGGCPAT
jgi:hypothetical protein